MEKESKGVVIGAKAAKHFPKMVKKVGMDGGKGEANQPTNRTNQGREIEAEPGGHQPSSHCHLPLTRIEMARRHAYKGKREKGLSHPLSW